MIGGPSCVFPAKMALRTDAGDIDLGTHPGRQSMLSVESGG